MTIDHDAQFIGSMFALELDGITIAYFTGCTGISVEIPVVSATYGNGKSRLVQKTAGSPPKYSEIVLKRGFTDNQDLYKWADEVVASAKKTPYKTASIVIYDHLGVEGARFNLENFWPSKISVSDLKADGNEFMVEELTIQHDLLTWN
jgi:phage tail-like protein